MVPVIDVYKCNGCGICIKYCPPQVMGLIKEKAVILDQLCEECGICVDVCPLDAILFKLPYYSIKDTHEAYERNR